MNSCSLVQATRVSETSAEKCDDASAVAVAADDGARLCVRDVLAGVVGYARSKNNEC